MCSRAGRLSTNTNSQLSALSTASRQFSMLRNSLTIEISMRPSIINMSFESMFNFVVFRKPDQNSSCSKYVSINCNCRAIRVNCRSHISLLLWCKVHSQSFIFGSWLVHATIIVWFLLSNFVYFKVQDQFLKKLLSSEKLNCTDTIQIQFSLLLLVEYPSKETLHAAFKVKFTL